MFERARIGGCIYNIANLLSRQGEPVDRHVRAFFEPLLPSAVEMMKQEKLKPDQVTVAFIIQTVNVFHSKGYLHELLMEEHDLLPSLVRLYPGAYALMALQPDYHAAAARIFDQRVLDSVDNLA